MNVNTTYPPPAEIDATRSRALVVGLVGLVVCGIGFAVNRDQFFRAWLIAYLVWLTVALGSMGLMMIHHLSGGAWGMVVRRVWEAASRDAAADDPALHPDRDGAEQSLSLDAPRADAGEQGAASQGGVPEPGVLPRARGRLLDRAGT